MSLRNRLRVWHSDHLETVVMPVSLILFVLFIGVLFYVNVLAGAGTLVISVGIFFAVVAVACLGAKS
jgi:hypothetical protein